MVPGVTRQANEKRVEGLNKDFFIYFFWNSYMIFRFIASWIMYKLFIWIIRLRVRVNQT